MGSAYCPLSRCHASAETSHPAGRLFAASAQPLVTVRSVAEHDYEVSCECGAQWRVRLEYDDDAMATCLACGADTFELVDLGVVHSAGAAVEWNALSSPG